MIEWILSGGFIPVLLLACGIFFLFYLKGYPFRTPGKMMRAFRRRREEGSVSPFRALTLALAGTLGVGNIVGVANALWIGGAGAVLWMWVSALIAMILKYAEIALAVAHRQRRDDGGFCGGAYYYIKDHFLDKRRTRTAVVMSALFVVLMVINTLSTGCIVQVNAIGSALSGVLRIPPAFVALLLILFILPFLKKGVHSVSAVTEWLVPVMSGGYAVLSVFVLILRWDAVGDAFLSIFQNAFSADSMAGGAVGFLTSRALRTGVMRGLLSNEAGCGTAPTAHASAHTDSPALQGVWGVVEVFVDTILLCTATALVILVAGEDAMLWGDNAVMMTIRAYSSVLGGWSEWFFCLALLCFGYATVLCCAGYGMESILFLSKKKRWRILFAGALAACILIGVLSAPDRIWGVSDFAITALTTVNLYTLVSMRKEIRRETFLQYREKG